MIKWLIISINLLVSLFVGNFFNGEINVKVEAPSSIVAGDEFQVKVTLSKGNLESFSRLMQELPAGLRATSISTSNADFTFKEQKVRFIWLKMPEEQDITVVYNIKVDQRLKGTFDLSGKFSYIDNNERMSVEAEPVNINILPNPNIDPSLIVDIHDFKEKVIPEVDVAGRANVACIRQKPQITEGDNGYIVNLLVYKEKAQKFAKIEEKVPAGFTAIKIDSKEGIFVFKDGMAKFLWMSLPSDPYFMVSYRLVPNPGVTTAPELNGQFSYVEDDKTLTKDIVEKDLMLASLNSDQLKQLVDEISSSVNIPLVALIPENTTTPAEETAPEITVPGKTVEETVEEPIIAEEKPKQVPEKVKKPKTLRNIDLAYKLEPEEGVYYRVQIAAGHKPIKIKQYFKKFKIADEVRAEEHNGWRKYSIGSFSDYKKARDYRVHIWNTTPISDAFIAAYNTGQRITVQEALMITSQKWYK